MESFWIMTIAALMAAGAFFAGTETAIYRLSRFKLRLGAAQHRPFFKQLGQAVHDGQGLVLSLLCGNNIANYLATSLLTWRLMDHLGGNSRLVEIYATAIMAPLLFIFVDIIPKNIFFHRADELTGVLAPAIWFVYRAFTISGAIWLLKKIFNAFSLLLGLPVDTAAVVDINQREQVRQLIQETREAGLLSAIQKDIIHRLLNIPDVPAGAVLIPLSKTTMIETNGGKNELLEILKNCPYRRLPVYEKERSVILGYVDIYKALAADPKPGDLKKMITPLRQIGASCSALNALNTLRSGQERLALVVSDVPAAFADTKKVLGIITLTDLAEEIIGAVATT